MLSPTHQEGVYGNGVRSPHPSPKLFAFGENFHGLSIDYEPSTAAGENYAFQFNPGIGETGLGSAISSDATGEVQ
jgi:hypothetical protein